ncbi:MAG: Ger(x)C family spore germination protein [Oscillospiraceae bacterium]|nr:Ger(x)C family spore germination protein [Oscillospiraceae bacterium]
MFKKTVSVLLILSQLSLLSGCWNYRGLDEMSVVIGIGVDKATKGGGYQLSFEIVDISAPVKDKGIQSKIIESEGNTIFDAVRNAKKRINNKLYFGQTQLVVFSNEIARNEDMRGIIDWFLRDGEMRQTVYAVISQEPTARDLLNSKGLGQRIVSDEIRNIVENDNYFTSSTFSAELYSIFDTIRAKGKTPALPAIHITPNNGEAVVEVNGTAVFNKESKLAGYLTPQESKYFLFAIDEIKGGVLTVSSSGDDRYDISLEIADNKTKRSFEFKDGKIKILITTDTKVYMDEAMMHNDGLDNEMISALETAASTELENCISQVIRRVQSEFGSDIFGFGNMIYKKDFRLWNDLNANWDEQFKTLEVTVRSDVRIVNTGALEKS